MAIDAPFARHVARDVKAHQGKVYCLGWDCEGQRLATGSVDKTVRVWNVEHRHKEKDERYDMEFKHSSRLFCLNWHPSNPDKLATSCEDKYIRTWDVKSHKGAYRIQTPGVNFYMAWNPHDPNILATGSGANAVTLIDMRKGKQLKTIKNRQMVNELAFSRDGKLFMQCTSSGVEVYSTATWEKLSLLPGHTGTVHSISISPDDRHMASGGEDGSVALWNLDSMACERTCTHMDGQVKTVSISHDSQYVAYAGEQDYLLMESLQAARKPWTLPIRGSQQNVVDSIAWNPKHLVLASAGAYSDGGSSKHAHTGNIIIYAPLVSS